MAYAMTPQFGNQPQGKNGRVRPDVFSNFMSNLPRPSGGGISMSAPSATTGGAGEQIDDRLAAPSPRRNVGSQTLSTPMANPNQIVYGNPMGAQKNATAMGVAAQYRADLPPINKPYTPPNHLQLTVQQAKTLWDNANQTGASMNGMEGYNPQSAFRQTLQKFGVDPEMADVLHQHFSRQVENPSMSFMTPDQRSFIQHSPDQISAAQAATPFAPGKVLPGYTPIDSPTGGKPIAMSPGDMEARGNYENQVANAQRKASINALDQGAADIQSNLQAPSQIVDPYTQSRIDKNEAQAKAAGQPKPGPTTRPLDPSQVNKNNAEAERARNQGIAATQPSMRPQTGMTAAERQKENELNRQERSLRGFNAYQVQRGQHRDLFQKNLPITTAMDPAASAAAMAEWDKSHPTLTREDFGLDAKPAPTTNNSGPTTQPAGETVSPGETIYDQQGRPHKMVNGKPVPIQ